MEQRDILRHNGLVRNSCRFICGAENMTHGKPWTFEEEKKLKDWVGSGIKSLSVLVFSFDGKYSQNAIYQKMLDLGLTAKEEEGKKIDSSSFAEPKEIPSIENILKNLNIAMEQLKSTSGLDKNEILRLRGYISACKIYKELLEDYLDYRGLEVELVKSEKKYQELKEQYAELAKKTANNAPK
jgi:hypothetical protein